MMDFPYHIHLLGFPHTATNTDYAACAYTQKIVKFVRMMHPRGHEIIHYGNEGSRVACEHVQIFSETERAGFYGAHDPRKPYNLSWDPSLAPWRIWNGRAGDEIGKRVKRGDFILGLAGNCHQEIADRFRGHAWFVEYGIGYYGTFSEHRVFESNTHREWVHGKANNTLIDWSDVCIPNYFDPAEFPADCDEAGEMLEQKEYLDPERRALTLAWDWANGPYYIFVGRITKHKGWGIAVDAVSRIGGKIILVGQNVEDPGPLPPHVYPFGNATIWQRGLLLQRATASFAPTTYREPFGGVAVEAQFAGTPCITTNFGGFVETVPEEWRCDIFRDYVEAAQRAKLLTWDDRRDIRARVVDKYSLDAIAPQYEKYFARVHARWGEGWYEMGDVRRLKANEHL